MLLLAWASVLRLFHRYDPSEMEGSAGEERIVVADQHGDCFRLEHWINTLTFDGEMIPNREEP